MDRMHPKMAFFTKIAKVGYLSQRSGQKPNQHEMDARTLTQQDNAVAQEQVPSTRTYTEEPAADDQPADDQPAESTPSAGRTLSHY